MLDGSQGLSLVEELLSSQLEGKDLISQDLQISSRIDLLGATILKPSSGRIELLLGTVGKDRRVAVLSGSLAQSHFIGLDGSEWIVGIEWPCRRDESGRLR